MSGSSLLVAAPTGAGKTLIADFAVDVALKEKRRAFYTTPIKALSNQKYRDLVALHGSTAVGLLTGDTSINPDAQIVVMTTEVLRNMIYMNPTGIEDVAWVILDEVHYLADRTRGAVWEEIIILLPHRVGLVCLSATVSNAEEFGAWLNEVRGFVEVIIDEKRPVPLHQMVYLPGRLIDLFDPRNRQLNMKLIRYAESHRRRTRGWRYHQDTSRRRRRVDRVEVVETLSEENMLPVIYFIFSRAGCQAAFEASIRAGLDFTNRDEKREIDRRLDEIETLLEPSDLNALRWLEFSDGLRRGIATHHAGMLPAFKEVVEQLFVSGLLSCVFATETLSVGINMPARSVVIEDLEKFDGHSHVSLTPGEFTQLTGRAGRRGIDREGFAAVVWNEGLEPGWVGSLASARTFPLKSRFRPDYNMSVSLIQRLGLEQSREILARSFAQYQVDHFISSGKRERESATLSNQFDRITKFLIDLDYLRAKGDHIVITDSGKLLARLHSEQDLLISQAIATGVFAGVPPAGLAAVVSCVVFEPRRDTDESLGRLPPEPVATAIIEMARLAEWLQGCEAQFGLNFVRPIEAGLSRTMWRWANGAQLSQVLTNTDFTAGDFFRWSRQCIDVLRQMARAVEGSELSENCLKAAKLVDRGIVAMAARI